MDVSERDRRVVIIHPYRIAFVDTGAWGERRVHFDIAKGMMPERVDVDYKAELESSNGSTLVWREERIVMDQARNFDGFWMPTWIEEHVRSSTSPENCQVFTTSVKDIVFGRVKETDLEVMFPADTLVADTIQNVFYRTGADGGPAGPVNPIGIPKGRIEVDAQGNPVLIPTENRARWLLRVGLWSIGIGINLLPVVIILRKRLLGSSGAIKPAGRK